LFTFIPRITLCFFSVNHTHRNSSKKKGTENNKNNKKKNTDIETKE